MNTVTSQGHSLPSQGNSPRVQGFSTSCPPLARHGHSSLPVLMPAHLMARLSLRP